MELVPPMGAAGCGVPPSSLAWPALVGVAAHPCCPIPSLPGRRAALRRVPVGTRWFRPGGRDEVGTSVGLCGAPPTAWGASPGANREAVFPLTGKQASCVCGWTDGASDGEPGASTSAHSSQPPAAVPGQPFPGGCPRGCADGWQHRGARGDPHAQNRRWPPCQEPWCVLTLPPSPSHPPTRARCHPRLSRRGPRTQHP